MPFGFGKKKKEKAAEAAEAAEKAAEEAEDQRLYTTSIINNENDLLEFFMDFLKDYIHLIFWNFNF